MMLTDFLFLPLASFEQDESPAAAGVFPGNGIAGKLAADGQAFLITLERPGRKGQLSPGKRSLPALSIVCVGLVAHGAVNATGRSIKKEKAGRGLNQTPGLSKEWERFGLNFGKVLADKGYSGAETALASPTANFQTKVQQLNGEAMSGFLFISSTGTKLFLPETGTK